jgi:hypothetical protein
MSRLLSAQHTRNGQTRDERLTRGVNELLETIRGWGEIRPGINLGFLESAWKENNGLGVPSLSLSSSCLEDYVKAVFTQVMRLLYAGRPFGHRAE